MDNRETLNAILRTNFSAFVERVFMELHADRPLEPNWHIDAICHTLMEVANGERRRQLIEIPPRSLKSICASVAFPAWLLGHDPSMNIIAVSYGQDLANHFSDQTRQVMKSAWYRELFPDTIIGSKDSQREFKTTRGGSRYSTSVGGTLTGRGADVIIIDDPSKADEIHSEAKRNEVNGWYDSSLTSRLNNKRTGRIVLVMQRLHPDDLAGHVKTSGYWTTLTLPAIAKEPARIQIGPDCWYDRAQHELLNPNLEPEEVLLEQKFNMGSRAFEAQYQQNPLSEDGGVIEWKNLRIFDTLPEGVTYEQSWDFASKDTEYSDYSVCTTWAVKGTDYYLIDVFRRQISFDDMISAILTQGEKWPISTILIEDAAAGTNLLGFIRLYKPINFPTPIGIKVERDKVTRLHSVSHVVDQGRVHIPIGAPWMDDFKYEMLRFPGGRYDDQVDSFSQFLIYRERKRMNRATIQVVPMFDDERFKQLERERRQGRR